MDEWNLERFVQAQDERGTYDRALAEITAGHKQTHWMWFVFPQLAGLGHSDMARRYGISGLAEASAYLAHPVLGARLRECVERLAEHRGRSAIEIFGPVDAQKLRSSLTLFAAAAPTEPIFQRALESFFDSPDGETLRWLARDTVD